LHRFVFVVLLLDCGVFIVAFVQSVADLYRYIIIETPLAPYFKETMREEDLDEMNVEIIRNTLYRSYLEDFYGYLLR
jgi:V-type H+-transporting ATPase subunit d